MRRGRLGIALVMLAGLALAACANAPVIPVPSEVPLGKDTLALLAKKGMQPGSPVFVRIFKEESELEIWKQRDDGRFYHFKTYPICNWSGELGPKLVHGDKQAPEGFYNVTPVLMNPNSKFYLSFNVGYPNSFDRALGRTGDSVMVHGKCRSAGCYAMTDALVEEIYGITREALKAGQSSFQLHAFPFHMTDARMAQMKTNKWFPFWKTLKQGYDHFETHRLPPSIAICEKRYVVNVTSQSKPEADAQCPAFQKPVIAAFTPLPTEVEPLVASGNKLKGLVSSDVEPTLADITAAKSAQGSGVVAVPVSSGSVASPAASGANK
jgi:murein L,D-transpeptidase YafK